MSYTSEEESEINFQQQHKLAVYEAALSKGSPIIPAAKKRRSHPGNPGKERVTAYIISVLMSSSDTSKLVVFNYHKYKYMIALKMVYICPEVTCPHHDASRALGDLTGIKKHYSRKHGEKKWKCERCSKKYAVQSDWRAHTKICGTKEYRCDCGTIFSRKDSFITHRAFCDALTEDNSRINQSLAAMVGSLHGFPNYFTSRNHIGISSGVLQTSTANSDRKKTAENNIIPYMNLPWAGSCVEANNTVPWIGLPPFSMRAENRSSNIADEDRMKQSAHESIFGVKGVGLTQDFLGLGGNGNVQMSDDTYNGDTSLSYSDEQQKSQEDIYSYHHYFNSRYYNMNLIV
uniref:Uncharacterized protein n=1 Tax=Avena sativa TaxID=4498 RepID=A0ACD5U9S3_AVESA